LRFLIYEHTAGGGYAGMPVPTDLTCEGYGMLRAFTLDLKAAGHHVSTTLDQRLKPLNHHIAADGLTYMSSPHQLTAFLQKMSKSADASLMIAPERDNTLLRLVELVEKTGCMSLNCPSETLRRFHGKSNILAALKDAGVPVPRTVGIPCTAADEEVEAAVETFGYPAVLKPDDGAGCSGLSLILNRSRVNAAAGLVRRETSAETFLIQEHLHGIPASVILLCGRGSVTPLSLNRQFIKIGEPDVGSRYYGGMLPLEHSLRAEALKVAKQAAETLGPLRGYVGVDLILAEDRVTVVEVNLRLTTSYLGLRTVAKQNLAEIGVEAALEEKLPTSINIRGYALFSKVEVPFSNRNSPSLERHCEVFVPPIQLPSSSKLCAILVTSATTPEGLERQFNVLSKAFNVERPPDLHGKGSGMGHRGS